MGWYGIFLIQNLKIAFSLRRVDEDNLYSNFDLLDKFFEKYDKLKEDMEFVQEIPEETKTFSAKAVAKMFNIIDGFSYLPEVSNDFLLLYFLHKKGFEIKYYPEDKINLDKLKKKRWRIIG